MASSRPSIRARHIGQVILIALFACHRQEILGHGSVVMARIVAQRLFQLAGVAAITAGILALFGAAGPHSSEDWMYALSLVSVGTSLLWLALAVTCWIVDGAIQRVALITFSYFENSVSRLLPSSGIEKWFHSSRLDVTEYLRRKNLRAHVILSLATMPLVTGVIFAFFYTSLSGFYADSAGQLHYNLITLTITFGAVFGFCAGYLAKTQQDLRWTPVFWHGSRVVVESAFLTYAGLWLSRKPAEEFVRRSQGGLLDDPITWMVLAGILLIGIGSISLILRQVYSFPARGP